MKHKTFLSLLFILHTIAIQGNDILTGNFSLNIPGRPTSPFPRLQNFNANLTKHGPAGKSFPVEVTRHHIIPLSHFTKFYNESVRRDEFSKFKTFWFRFSQRFNEFYFYKALEERNETKYNTIIKNVDKIFEGLFYNKIVHDAKAKRPANFDDFQAYYAWLPGNTFVGPAKRSDDPGELFERNARAIVGSKRFADFKKTYTMMQFYIDGKKIDFDKLSDILRDLATPLESEDLKHSDWVQNKDGTYKIKTSN